MAEITPRLGLEKRSGTDHVTRKHFNDNWDVLETKVETIEGAQSKATTAEQSAKQYTDEKVGSIPDPTWDNLQNKPSEFAPEAHNHSISDVNGLQSELDGKASTNHSHDISDVNGLQSEIDNLKTFVSDGKGLIRDAVADRGGDAPEGNPEDYTFQDLADSIYTVGQTQLLYDFGKTYLSEWDNDISMFVDGETRPHGVDVKDFYVHMYVENERQGTEAYTTVNRIDLTEWRKLKWTFDISFTIDGEEQDNLFPGVLPFYSELIVSDEYGENQSVKAERYQSDTGERITIELDISDINGNYYVRRLLHKTNTRALGEEYFNLHLNSYRVWLEK